MSGVLVVLLAALWFFWSWDWFLPLVDSQASAALGRASRAEHLHVRLGATTRIELDGIRIAEPAKFPEERPFATIARLTVAIRPLDYLRGRGIVIPEIALDRAAVVVRGRADGRNNVDFAFMHTTGGASGPSPKLGTIEIAHSHVDVDWATLRAKFGLDVHTTGGGGPERANERGSDAARIVVSGSGTYAGQPITLHLVSGALLTLRDRAHPYPLDLAVANGPTHVTLAGTIEDPLHFAGANLRLVLAGPDMRLLYPLTGVPIPSTPPYRIAGRLDYSKSRITFRDFEGTLGSSDIGGDIAVDPSTKPPQLTATLASREVNLADLGGFIGASPGHPAANRAAHEGDGAKSGTNVLPTTPISLPKLKAMDVDLHYRAAHIEGRSIPLDNLVTAFVIRNGAVDVRQLDFGVGRGTLASNATLTPEGSKLRATARVDIRHVDLSHLLNATHVFHGRGIIGGQAELRGTGASIAELVANGSGGVTMFMRDGGDISALLPDIAGLEFGNALLSALGIPQRAEVQCFVAKLPLDQGILNTQIFVLQTSEARTTGTGTVNFRDDTLDYALTTRSTKFSVGSLPGPIHVGGSLSSPSILPGAEVVARSAAAVGLGIVFPPLAILPTIQLGVGQSPACEAALRGAGPAPAASAAPAGAGASGAPHLSRAQVRKAWHHRLHPD